MSFLLETKNLSKSFPGVHALKNVNFQCQSGVIHGLVGENGAGKSTLIKIVSGAHHIDQGELLFKGQKVSFRSPRDAISKGIRVVYQEFTLVPYLSVAENICLGSLPTKYLSLDRKSMNRRACNFMERLGLNLDPDMLVRDLSIAEQQFVEIVKATSKETSLLILDEPTAALNSQQVERLMVLIKDVQKTGIGIIFVSHRLSEVLHICDETTVLKDGEIVGTYPTSELNQDVLVSRMVGRELRYTFPEHSTQPSKEPLLQVKNMVSKSMLHPVTFTLHRNEILGVYGLEGQGQREFLRTLAGLETPIEGQTILAQKTIRHRRTREAIRNGVAYTPADRKAEGLATTLSVQKNIGMPILNSNRGQIIYLKKLTLAVEQQVKNLRIKVTSHQMKTVNLSGGNQQKIVIGKWLGVNPKVLILDEPTRGIDVESKMEIYTILRDLSNSGVGIMVLSSDLIELIGLCDRMIIFFEGRITGELGNEVFSEEKIMAYATGASEGSK